MSLSSPRLLAGLATVALVTLTSTACKSDDGSSNDSADPTSSSVATSSTPATPTTAATTATTGLTTEVTTDASTATGGCAAGADVCETFDTDTAGWPDENSADAFVAWDAYQGGTYRMGIRKGTAISVPGPYDLTDYSPQYGALIDVDVLLGTGSPAGSAVGVGCWGGSDSGTYFELLLDDENAYIALVSGSDVHVIDKEPAAGVLDTTGGVNHLTAQCVQTPTGGADLALTANGQQVATTEYDSSVKSYAWAVGPQVLMVVDGPSIDAFFDNFAITGV